MRKGLLRSIQRIHQYPYSYLQLQEALNLREACVVMAKPARKRNAPGNRPGAPQKVYHQQQEAQVRGGGSEEWTAIQAELERIRESLEEKDAQTAQQVREVIARVKHASQGADATTSVEARLGRIESLLTPAGGTPRPSQTGIPMGATYASVAASTVRSASETASVCQPGYTVRVQLQGAKDLPPEEILREVKKTISGAAAIRVLRSGDVDVTVASEEIKDRAQSLPSTENLKIIRRDYFLEVPSVPLTTGIAEGKQADNTVLAASICEASRVLSPGLRITQIQWLHDQQHAPRARPDGSPKRCGTLIIGVQTQTMQRAAVRGGLVINAHCYEARLFDRNLIATQCFRCQQWGHTQNACGKQEKCGQCAGAHSTKTCTKDSVSCANCGKKHRAWQRRECLSYQAYFQDIQRRRIALNEQAQSIRGASNAGSSYYDSSSSQSQAQGWTIATRKRQRAASPAGEETQRRAGRPTYVEQAARHPGQTRIAFGQRVAFGTPPTQADEAQAGSTEDAPVAEADEMQNE